MTELCADSIEPPLDFSLHRVPTPKPPDHGVLVVEVPAGRAVHRSPGGFFRRRGNSKRLMASAEIRRLRGHGHMSVKSTDTQVVAGTGIATLDPELWRRYASSRAGDTDEVALSKLRFVMEDAQGVVRATVGGVLLASRDPREWLAGAFIQAVCYDGGWMDRDRQLDALDITAPLDQQIRDAVRFVARNRRVAARKEPARRDVPQYSDRAVFKAIVNALVHRDYAVSGSKTRLFMAGALLSRQPWQLHERGGLANEPVHAQRAAGVAIGPVSGRRGGGRRQSAVLHRETGRGSRRDRRRDVCAPLAQASLRGRRRPGAEAGPAVSQSAVPDGVSARVAVVHADTGQPLRDVHVLMVYPNKTFREARTDAFGHADFELYAKLPMTVFCAAHGFAAQVVSGWRPGDGAGPSSEVQMRPAPDGGSVIFPDRTGHVPGLRGRLNPIRRQRRCQRRRPPAGSLSARRAPRDDRGPRGHGHRPVPRGDRRIQRVGLWPSGCRPSGNPRGSECALFVRGRAWSIGRTSLPT